VIQDPSRKRIAVTEEENPREAGTELAVELEGDDDKNASKRLVIHANKNDEKA